MFTMIVSFSNHEKSYKINQDHLKISQISCIRIGLALTHTHHLYVLPNHIQNTTSTQEVDGYLRDGSLATVSWSENGGKIEDKVSQMDLVSRIPY